MFTQNQPNRYFAPHKPRAPRVVGYDEDEGQYKVLVEGWQLKMIESPETQALAQAHLEAAGVTGITLDKFDLLIKDALTTDVSTTGPAIEGKSAAKISQGYWKH